MQPQNLSDDCHTDPLASSTKHNIEPAKRMKQKNRLSPGSSFIINESKIDDNEFSDSRFDDISIISAVSDSQSFLESTELGKRSRELFGIPNVFCQDRQKKTLANEACADFVGLEEDETDEKVISAILSKTIPTFLSTKSPSLFFIDEEKHKALSRVKFFSIDIDHIEILSLPKSLTGAIDCEKSTIEFSLKYEIPSRVTAPDSKHNNKIVASSNSNAKTVEFLFHKRVSRKCQLNRSNSSYDSKVVGAHKISHSKVLNMSFEDDAAIIAWQNGMIFFNLISCIKSKRRFKQKFVGDDHVRSMDGVRNMHSDRIIIASAALDLRNVTMCSDLSLNTFLNFSENRTRQLDEYDNREKMNTNLEKEKLSDSKLTQNQSMGNMHIKVSLHSSTPTSLHNFFQNERDCDDSSIYESHLQLKYDNHRKALDEEVLLAEDKNDISTASAEKKPRLLIDASSENLTATNIIESHEQINNLSLMCSNANTIQRCWLRNRSVHERLQKVNKFNLTLKDQVHNHIKKEVQEIIRKAEMKIENNCRTDLLKNENKHLRLIDRNNCCEDMSNTNFREEREKKNETYLNLEKLNYYQSVNKHYMSAESALADKHFKMCVHINQSSGIREIIFLWVDNLRKRKYWKKGNSFDSTGVMITFAIPYSVNYSSDKERLLRRYFSTRILRFNQLFSSSFINYDASTLIENSDSIMKYFQTGTVNFDLWFIPFVTDDMLNEYPKGNSESMNVPITAENVCQTTYPLIGLIHQTGCNKTLQCPWIISLACSTNNVETENVGFLEVCINQEKIRPILHQHHTVPNPISRITVDDISTLNNENMSCKQLLSPTRRAEQNITNTNHEKIGKMIDKIDTIEIIPNESTTDIHTILKNKPLSVEIVQKKENFFGMIGNRKMANDQELINKTDVAHSMETAHSCPILIKKKDHLYDIFALKANKRNRGTSPIKICSPLKQAVKQTSRHKNAGLAERVTIEPNIEAHEMYDNESISTASNLNNKNVRMTIRKCSSSLENDIHSANVSCETYSTSIPNQDCDDSWCERNLQSVLASLDVMNKSLTKRFVGSKHDKNASENVRSQSLLVQHRLDDLSQPSDNINTSLKKNKNKESSKKNSLADNLRSDESFENEDSRIQIKKKICIRNKFKDRLSNKNKKKGISNKKSLFSKENELISDASFNSIDSYVQNKDKRYREKVIYNKLLNGTKTKRSLDKKYCSSKDDHLAPNKSFESVDTLVQTKDEKCNRKTVKRFKSTFSFSKEVEDSSSSDSEMSAELITKARLLLHCSGLNQNFAKNNSSSKYSPIDLDPLKATTILQRDKRKLSGFVAGPINRIGAIIRNERKNYKSSSSNSE